VRACPRNKSKKRREANPLRKKKLRVSSLEEDPRKKPLLLSSLFRLKWEGGREGGLFTIEIAAEEPGVFCPVSLGAAGACRFPGPREKLFHVAAHLVEDPLVVFRVLDGKETHLCEDMLLPPDHFPPQFGVFRL